MDQSATCAIVGVGATGSNLACLVARLHMADVITLYDADVVAEHNLKNQCFSRADVGIPKVIALSRSIAAALGTNIVPVPEFVREKRDLGSAVFLCTDSMGDTKQIMEQSLFHNSKVQMVFQSRMDAARCVTYAIDPNNQLHIDMWQHYWFPDDQAENETLACGGARSVCYTPFIAAALMAESYDAWKTHLSGEGNAPPQMRWLDLRRNTMGAEYW